jgi:hypothetical protein
MEDLITMIVNGETPSDVSDKIKELLYMRAAEKVESLKPEVAASVFGDEQSEY